MKLKYFFLLYCVFCYDDSNECNLALVPHIFTIKRPIFYLLLCQNTFSTFFYPPPQKLRDTPLVHV